MANSVSILAKIARNAEQIGLTVVSQTASEVVIDNASNDLHISYVAASIASPQGGVDPSVSPFLGIGIGNPGQIKMKSSSTANDNMTDIVDSQIAAQVLALLAGFANDLVLENSDASFSVRLRGTVDMLGMGQ
jgi:hypothetical protein